MFWQIEVELNLRDETQTLTEQQAKLKVGGDAMLLVCSLQRCPRFGVSAFLARLAESSRRATC